MVKKELLFFFILMLGGTLFMHHQALLSYPITHLTNLSTSGAYGFGAFHPLIFTALLYLLLWIPRFIFHLFQRALTKN
jgi:hypothetical protein